MPHGALTLAKESPHVFVPPAAHALHDACTDAARRIRDLKPDLILLTTPHGVSLNEAYVIYGNSKAAGSAEWDGKWKEYTCEVDVAVETSQSLCDYLTSTFHSGTSQDTRFEVVTSFAPSENIPLRWGEVIPIWFIQQQTKTLTNAPRYIFFSMPRKRLDRSVEMIPELFQIGKNLRDFFSEMQERVVVVISGDLAHTHPHQYPEQHPTPFGVNTNAENMDATLERWVTTLDLSLLHVEATKYIDTYVCGYTGFVALSGLMVGKKWDSQVLCRAHPTYYGMMVATFLPNPPPPFTEPFSKPTPPTQLSGPPRIG